MGVILGACFDDEYMPDLQHLIHHNSRDCKIYGRGDNRDGHLSNDDDGYARYEWQRISELEKVLIKKAKFKHLYINYESLSILNNSNEIYVAGNNKYYKLGIIPTQKEDDEAKEKNPSNDDVIRHFTKIPFDTEQHGNPILLSQGIYCKEMSFIYTDSNKLLANGKNWVGGFGNGQTNDDPVIVEPIPQFWSKDEKISEIHCGSSFTLFLTNIHNLYGTGYYSGIGTDGHISTPQLLHDNIVKVKTGIYHSLLVDVNNKLIINGSDESSAEITGSETKRNIETFFNETMESILSIVSIHSGYRHGMIICENLKTKQNECYTFGNNQNGQIGDGNMIKDGDKIVTKPYLVKLGEDNNRNEYVIQGSVGGNHNVLLTNKNNVWTFGSNWSKKCGNDIFPPVYDVDKPYLMDKEKDLKINKTDKIQMVIATTNATLIVVGSSDTV